jgi:hypothetical protein
MSIEIQTLLENISVESTDSSFVYSHKKPAAGYHRKIENLHTVSYVVVQFIGALKLQGTLKVDPSDEDWFDIDNTSISGDSTLFNNGTLNINFTGNFVWIRAAYNIQNGSIIKILLGF